MFVLKAFLRVLASTFLHNQQKPKRQAQWQCLTLGIQNRATNASGDETQQKRW